MTIQYRTPSQIAQQYLTSLKAQKTEVDISRTDSDWWVRSRVNGGFVAGVYADQQLIANDAFPQSARREALERHLETWFDEGFTQPTPAVGSVGVTGTAGTVIQIGQLWQYAPNGNGYGASQQVTIGAAGTGTVAVESIVTGQAQNLFVGAALTAVSPPAGLQVAGVAATNISDGRNVESSEQASTRILNRIRAPLAGGKVSDYEDFAREADGAVVTATVLRYPFGFGTVGVVITAGTSDIDEAVDNGQPVVFTPSDELIAAVQTSIETKNPITDCATVMAAATTPIDVTVLARFRSGTATTIVTGQTLSQGDLVRREVARALYKTPPGGVKFGSVGYVLASEIENVIDQNLAATKFQTGQRAQILIDRQVMDLAASGPNRILLGHEQAVPGTITVLEF